MKTKSIFGRLALVICVFVFILNLMGADWNRFNLNEILEEIETLVNELKTDANANIVLQKVRCLDYADLAGETTVGSAAKLDIQNETHFVIGDYIYEKAVTGSITMTTAAGSYTTITEGNRCRFLVSLTSAGVVWTTQGTVVASTETASFPDLPSGQCPIGGFQISCGSGIEFTPATTVFTAASISPVFYNLYTAPGTQALITSTSSNTDNK